SCGPTSEENSPAPLLTTSLVRSRFADSDKTIMGLRLQCFAVVRNVEVTATQLSASMVVADDPIVLVMLETRLSASVSSLRYAASRSALTAPGISGCTASRFAQSPTATP